ncbi:uncharacterized protein LOC142530833 isoform X1 [Primulina tabacum]|uniref:uncharacterized protein LOC142530833 isoform X1 n=1 Tax=Primulina tabacum TaxID=48773 RepID=UPI003F5A60BE
MGELGVVSKDGVVFKEEERLVWSLGTPPPPPPDPASFSEDCLSAAEEAAAEVVNYIHPTLDSDENRRDVIDHLQRLIKTQLNCEVFPYGSVPLKTYLPDGDIDLTVLKGPNVEESLAYDVFTILKKEEHKDDTDYQVMDTQFIDAEVKLVKCLVRNIVIDISFNQLGGLSTLCFLEQVDRLVGKNHLFKRSIILIKAWCFYESRILGAMHGLVSTYALETLILYIFHLFHSSLSGPLMALYRFLDYYSQFDWDNYCISLKGPVRKSSLPNIVVKLPKSGWNDLLLGEEFMENCVEMFSVPHRGSETNQKAFQTKHLNIIDPLKENNNLGRSVHRGNFHRIRSAFRYGARKLGKVLLQPRDKVAEEINKFFANILVRHGNLSRSCLEHFALEFGGEVSSTIALSADGELFSEDGKLLKSSVSDFNEDNVGIEEKYILKNNLDRCLAREVPAEMTSQVLRSPAKNESFEAGNFRLSDLVNAHVFDGNSWLKNREKYAEISNMYQLCGNNLESLCINGSGSSIHKPGILENLCGDVREVDSSDIGGVSETIDSLADLCGDYDSHIRSLLHGQLCHGFASSASMVSNPPLAPFLIRSKKRLDIVPQSMPLRRTFSQTTTSSEGKANKGFYRKRSSQKRDMNKKQDNQNQFLNNHRSNCLYPDVSRSKSFGSDSHDVLPAQSRSEGQLESDVEGLSPCSVIDGKQTNSNSSPCRIEFGSIGNLAEELLSRFTNVSGSTPSR